MSKRNSDLFIRTTFISIIILLFILISYCIYKDNKCEIENEVTVGRAEDLVIDVPDDKAYGTVTIYDPYGKLFSCIGNITISTDENNESQIEIIVDLPK